MAKSRSLSWLLGVSTLVIVLPLVVFAWIMVGWIAHDEREAEKKQLIGDAYAFADTVGREINAYFLLSAALSHSKLLQRGDLTGFADQARDTLAEAPGVKLVVSTADGAPVLSLPPEPADFAALAQSSGARSAGVRTGLRLSFGRRCRPCLARGDRLDRNPRVCRWQACLRNRDASSPQEIPRSHPASELPIELAVRNRRSQRRLCRADPGRIRAPGDAGERGVSRCDAKLARVHRHAQFDWRTERWFQPTRRSRAGGPSAWRLTQAGSELVLARCS